MDLVDSNLRLFSLFINIGVIANFLERHAHEQNRVFSRILL